ncbi:MAG: hypothetical protein AAF730_16655 [Bacteroidota bacterium]
MAKKVNKNQRTNRGRQAGHKDMAKVVVAFKKQNGQYSFAQKFVPADQVQAELKAARS